MHLIVSVKTTNKKAVIFLSSRSFHWKFASKLSFNKFSLVFLPDIFIKKTRKQCSNLTIFFLSFFRHQITSYGRKCVRAKAGLNPYDKKAEIIRESCNDPIEKGPVFTRLFFKNIQKYVCFDRCGRLRTKVIHNSNSVISPVKTMRFHKILSITLINQLTSKSKVLFIGF